MSHKTRCKHSLKSVPNRRKAYGLAVVSICVLQLHQGQSSDSDKNTAKMRLFDHEADSLVPVLSAELINEMLMNIGQEGKAQAFRVTGICQHEKHDAVLDSIVERHLLCRRTVARMDQWNLILKQEGGGELCARIVEGSSIPVQRQHSCETGSVNGAAGPRATLHANDIR